MPAASCVLDFVSMASQQGFPILIAESLPRYVAGVTAANAWSTWFEPFFNTLLAEPAVKGFSYINRDCGTDPKVSLLYLLEFLINVRRNGEFAPDSAFLYRILKIYL